jgi:L-asparaginase type II
MPPKLRTTGRFALGLLLLAAPGTLSAQRDAASRPKVLIIGTGGTISGVQDAPGTLGGYRAGALTTEQIVASVPPLANYAQIETEQFSNVASTMITTEQWVALARRIDGVLRNRRDLAGVVVTHGTDRLEETAFFLYLTIHSEKPVVVVGAQRPATGISPDGPINLLSAVRTAAAPQSVGKGVMVVMDDRIISAREARKLYPRAGGFSSGEMGMLGVVSSAGPEYFFVPARRRGSASEFDLDGLSTLPTVELTFAYPGGTGPRLEQAPAGIVVSSTGFTCAESRAFQALARAGTVVVTAFPSGEHVEGGTREPEPVRPRNDSTPRFAQRMCPGLDSAFVAAAPWIPTLVAQHLTPAKARILLMLALTRTKELLEIQRMFDSY